MMQIIDPTKLCKWRELVDEEIACTCVEHDCARDAAYFKLAVDQFQTSIDLRYSKNGWWSCCVIENLGYYCFHGPWERVASGHLSAHDAAKWILASTLVGRDPECIMIGAIIQLLDSECDIGMSFDVFRTYYGMAAIENIVDAVACKCRCRSHDADEWLFPRSLDEQLAQADRTISKELRSLTEAWADYYACEFSSMPGVSND